MPKAWNSTLNRGTSKLKRSPLNPVNKRRREKRHAEQYGPDGADGLYATMLRHRPCDTCGRGRKLPKIQKAEGGWTLDLERLRLGRRQCDPSHVITKGAGGKWWEQISQCPTCHRVRLPEHGWGPAREPALLLAAALAWAAVDNGLVDEKDAPPCSRPDQSIESLILDLRAAWAERGKV